MIPQDGLGTVSTHLDDEIADYFRAHYPRLVGFLRKASELTEETAHQAAQHAFLVLRKKWPDLRQPGQNPRAYLYKTAENWVRRNDRPEPLVFVDDLTTFDQAMRHRSGGRSDVVHANR